MFDHDHSSHHHSRIPDGAGAEKSQVALLSVFAALLLTGTKVSEFWPKRSIRASI
jgi:hypothetical protein